MSFLWLLLLLFLLSLLARAAVVSAVPTDGAGLGWTRTHAGSAQAPVAAHAGQTVPGPARAASLWRKAQRSPLQHEPRRKKRQSGRRAHGIAGNGTATGADPGGLDADGATIFGCRCRHAPSSHCCVRSHAGHSSCVPYRARLLCRNAHASPLWHAPFT